MNLLDLLKTVGNDNVSFLLPMSRLHFVPVIGLAYTTSSDPQQNIICKISEDKYKLSDNYKTTLVSTTEGYGQKHFYISDLESLIREGTFKIFLDPKGFEQTIHSNGLLNKYNKLLVQESKSLASENGSLHELVSQLISNFNLISEAKPNLAKKDYVDTFKSFFKEYSYLQRYSTTDSIVPIVLKQLNDSEHKDVKIFVTQAQKENLQVALYREDGNEYVLVSDNFNLLDFPHLADCSISLRSNHAYINNTITYRLVLHLGNIGVKKRVALHGKFFDNELFDLVDDQCDE